MTFVKDLETGSLRYRPVAVVDIGSNSVRLVVYDGLRRAPTPVVQRKDPVRARASGVALTGNLPADAIDAGAGGAAAVPRARPADRRRTRSLPWRRPPPARQPTGQASSTAPKRRSVRRSAFLPARKRRDSPPLASSPAFPTADGIVGDLGGGSLELIDVKDGDIRDGVTLPLGPLRLIDMSGGSVAKARSIIDDASRADRTHGAPARAATSMPSAAPGAISPGSTWRQTDYPLTCPPSLHHGSRAGALGGRPGGRSVAGLAQGRASAVAQPRRHAALWRAGAGAHPDCRQAAGGGRLGLWRARGPALLQARQAQARERSAAGRLLGFRPPLCALARA